MILSIRSLFAAATIFCFLTFMSVTSMASAGDLAEALRVGKELGFWNQSLSVVDLEVKESAARRSKLVTYDALAIAVTGNPPYVRFLEDKESLRNTTLGLNFQPDLPLLNMESVRRTASSIIEVVGKTDGLVLTHIKLLANQDPGGGLIGRGVYEISYDFVNSGYFSHGNGNSLRMVLDCQSGKLLSLNQRAGFTYSPPDGIMSTEEAMVIAKQTEVGEPIKIMLYYQDAAILDSKRIDDKECRLVYTFTYPGSSVSIDAETGVKRIDHFASNQPYKETKQDGLVYQNEEYALSLKGEKLGDMRSVKSKVDSLSLKEEASKPGEKRSRSSDGAMTFVKATVAILVFAIVFFYTKRKVT